MAGLFPGANATPDAVHHAPVQRTIPPAERWVSREGTTVGKFFLFIIAVSVAVLLAMGIYIISL